MVSRGVASFSSFSAFTFVRASFVRTAVVRCQNFKSANFSDLNQLVDELSLSASYGFQKNCVSQLQRSNGSASKLLHGVISSVDYVSRFRVLSSRGYQFRPCAALGTGTEERQSGGGRYCILLTGHASDYTERLYGGYSKMFVKLLGDPEDIWDVYPVVDGRFPEEEELEKYDGFVLTGSRHDAHGREEWILKLCHLLQSLHEKKRKMLGICFGHQVISRALGGRTGKAEVGWEVGVRNVKLTDALLSKSYSAGVPPVLRVYEVHRDQVKEIPPGGELLGFSERTGIEMYSVGDHVLAIQGHPEFTEDVVEDIIKFRLSAGILKEEEAKSARDSMKGGPPDREVLQQLCKAFLKGKRG